MEEVKKDVPNRYDTASEKVDIQREELSRGIKGLIPVPQTSYLPPGHLSAHHEVFRTCSSRNQG